MGAFLTQDRVAYRRWVNVFPNLLLPGSAQFLSGRKRAGVIWFLLSLFVGGLYLWLYVSPFVKSTIYARVANAFQVGVCLAAIIDGTRKGIPRLKVRAWAAFCLLALGIPFSLALFIRQFLFQPFAMPSHSMEPTLMGDHKAPAGSGQGDRIFVNKWSYRFEPPKRGDIAVFRTAGIERSRRNLFRIPEGQYYIKRVVGLPGERISIRAPYIYINGRELLEPKIFETIASVTNGYQGFTNAWDFGVKDDEIVLGSDEYFVVGDNTRISLDSRHYGPIRRKFFIGKIGWIYWPPERRGFPQ